MPKPTKDVTDKRTKLMTTVAEMAKSPSKFSEIMLGHKLFKYNQEYADSKERFIVYRSGRQAGKTMTTAVKAIHFAFFAPLMLDTVNHECTIVIAAPTQNQSGIMFDRIRSLIMNNDFLKKKIFRHN